VIAGPEFDSLGTSFHGQKARAGISPAVVFGMSVSALHASRSMPFSGLLETPVAAFGALLAPFARRMENGVYAQIGLVMRNGLSAKNAILGVEFAKRRLEAGASTEEAALEGARRRLLPAGSTRPRASAISRARRRSAASC
jgi:HAE1 family hydrophobic/amphiphilic exporter-1